MMNRMNYTFFVWVLLILHGCAGAHINIPVGPVSIGTDISTSGDSNGEDADDDTSDDDDEY